MKRQHALILLAVAWVWAGTGFAQLQNASDQHEQQMPAVNRRAVAVLDLSLTAHPGPLVDLLLVKLGADPDLRLVERDQIGRVKTEQLLANFNAGNRADVVKLGQLLKADVFLLLQDSAATNSAAAIRVRVVDAWFGFKLMDFTVPVAEAGQLEKVAAAIARRVSPRLKAVPKDTAKLRLVGVGPFRSEEPAARSWDYLGETIRAGVERWLAQYEGVIVLERDKLGALNVERTLAEGLPEKLLASGILVDGSFALDRAAGSGRLKVYVRSRNATGRPQEKEFSTEVGQLELLCQQIARDVAGEFATLSSTNLDAALESQLLALEAEYYLRHGEPVPAVGPAEAALALDPTNLTNKLLVLRSLKALTDYVFDSEKDVASLLCRWSETYNRMFDLVEDLVARATAKPFYREIVGYFGFAEGGIGAKPVVEAEFCASLLWPVPTGNITRENRVALEAYRRVQARQRSLYELLYANADKHPFRSHRQRLLRFAVRHGAAWQPSAATMLATQRALYDQAVEFIAKRDHSQGLAAMALLDWHWPFRYPQHPLWDDAAQAETLMDAFYTELVGSSNIWYRAAGLLTVVQRERQLAIRDKAHYGLARRYMEQLSRLATDEIYPTNPKVANAVDGVFTVTLGNGNFDADSKVNEEFRRDFYQSYYERAPTNEWIPRPQPWPIPPPQPIEYHWQELVSRSECNGLPGLESQGASFYGLIHTGNTLAIVCVFGNVNYAGRPMKVGLIWLNPETGQPDQGQVCPVELTWTWRGGPLPLDWAATRDAIYVTTPDTGLLVFSKSQAPRVLDMAHGLIANSLGQPVVIGQRLYALVNPGRGGYEGVIEVNLSNNVSRTLFSTRDKRRTGALSGTPLLGLAADAQANRLWVLTTDKICTHDLDTDTDRVEELPALQSFKKPSPFVFLSDFRGYGETIMNSVLRWPSLVNMRSREVVLLPEEFCNSIHSQGGGRLVPVASGVVGFNHRTMFAWRSGSTSVMDLSGVTPAIGGTIDVLARSVGREPGDIRGIAASSDGLLVLTGDALYRIPELR